MKLEGIGQRPQHGADFIQVNVISSGKSADSSEYPNIPAVSCTTSKPQDCILQARSGVHTGACAKRYGFFAGGAGLVRNAAAIAPMPPASNASISSVLNRLVGRK